MRTYHHSGGAWKTRVALGCVCIGTALIGIVVAQTLPGTACPSFPFEIHGLLYSGSAPAGFPKGDGWAQGASFQGVLDDDGLPALNGNGHAYRAARAVDPNWGNSGDGYDPTLFAGGNKNSDLIGLGQSPWEWGGGGGSPQKNDISNNYFHTRVDPLTGDRWVFVAAETRSTNGDSHVDFEFNQAGVVATGTTSGVVVGLGPDGGRTIDDYLISVDFEQGGTHPVATIRAWNGAAFVIVEVPNSIFSATNLIDIPHGASGSWKHFSSDGAEVNVLSERQFVEGAVNLSALGINVDPCNTDATFTAKTRSSSSWSADLKDFAIVHFPMEMLPDLEITAPSAVCNATDFSASVVDHTGLPKTSFLWSVSGCGQITSDPTATTVDITADQVCGCTMRLSVSAMGGECRQTAITTALVVIGDDTAPDLSQEPADRLVECDAVPRALIVTATDDCSPVPVSFREETQAGTCVGDSTIERTWSAVDGCQNETIHIQTVTVQDTVAPALLGVPQNVQASCDAIPASPEVTASDNCSDAGVDLGEVRIPGRCVGEETIKRTWTATDDCGNETSRTQTIIVEDESAPELAGVPADAQAECDAVPQPAVVSATDNCSIAVVHLQESEVNGSCDGDWLLTREWSATDSCGNRTAKTQHITVEDTTAPHISGVPADAIVECNAIPPPANATATDNCSDPRIDFSELTVPGPDAGESIITRTWTATDECGNASSKVQVVNVVDTNAPKLHGVPSNTTAECDNIPDAPQVTATDNCSNPVVRMTETRQDGNCDGRWTIVRTWTTRDAAGNEVTQTQLIHVADTTSPVFDDNLPADLTAECDAIPSPAAVTAKDNCSQVTVRLREVGQPGNCGGRSEITRTWTATDDCGNTSTHVQVIAVVDTEAPRLSADPPNIVAECDQIPNAPTITASDDCDSTIPVQFTKETTPGSCIGESTIERTWRATDDCGNRAEVSQVVNVRDTKSPTISISPTSGQVICEGRPATFDLRATDKCSAAIFAVSNIQAITANSRDLVTVTSSSGGTTRISATGPAYIVGEVTAEDDCGNASQPFDFTVTARQGREACSQGFWRNHPERWSATGFSASMRFVDAFRIVNFSSPEIPTNFNRNMTLHQAANMTGGSLNQLLLQGSAALLNAAHPDVDYPLSVAQVRSAMQDAFAGRISLSEARAIIDTGQSVEGECGCPLN